MKLEVQALEGNKVRARGKVWPKGQPEPAAWTIERVDPIGSHKGSAGPLRRRAVARRWRARSSTTTTSRSIRTSNACPSTLVAAARPRTHRSPFGLTLSTLALVARSDPGKGDWPMWGGTPDRNLVSNMKGLPTSWDIKTKKNIKWVAELGSQAYGNPVCLERRRPRRHQQRSDEGSGRQGRQGHPDGVPRVRRPVPVAGRPRQADRRPRQRLAVPGHLLVAARRKRHRLLRLQPRRSHGGRHRRLPRQGRTTAVQGREAAARDRRRHHLALRHDGRARRLPAQHGELVAGRLRKPDLRQHVERPGREPRERAVAEVAGNHRARQDDRQAGLGRRVAGRQDPPRAVVVARGRQDRRHRAGRRSARATAGCADTRPRPARSSGSST